MFEVDVRIAGKSFLGLLLGLLTALAAPAQALASDRLALLDLPEIEIVLEERSTAHFALSLVSKQTGGGAKIAADVFSLENPSRLVIDLPSIALKNKEPISLESEYISAIRLGAHEDRTRIVLDVASSLPPKYTVETNELLDSVLVNFTVIGVLPMETAAKARKRNLAEPAITSTGLVEGIVFVPQGPEAPRNAVIRVEGLNGYTLKRVRQHGYRLRFNDAVLADDGLLEPLSDEELSDGFYHIKFSQEQTNVLVDISTSSDIELGTRLSGDNLWLEPKRIETDRSP